MTQKEGFKTLTFAEILKMEEKLSDTVVDQFVQHCKHLEKLELEGADEQKVSETDLMNTLDFFARVLEAQEDDKMQTLKVNCFG